MFASNQIFDITFEFCHMTDAICFGVRLYGNEPFTRDDGRIKMAWATPRPGVYALGYGSMKPYTTGPNAGWACRIGNGWTDYPFYYDPNIIAPRVIRYLQDQNYPEKPYTDGSATKGFRIMSLHTAIDAGIIDPVEDAREWALRDAILIIVPEWMTYDK